MTSIPTNSPTRPRTDGVGAISADRLTVRFGSTTALDELTCTIEPGRITGLLGRNGAGKSTLLRTIAGYLPPTSGRLTVGGVAPFEHAPAMADTVLVRDKDRSDSMSFNDLVGIAPSFRPRFDRRYVEELAERFGINRKKNLEKLSTGQAAAARIAIGLASRCAVTIFDEPHSGLDATTRFGFYEELLADYARHPRTIIVSTHIIDEISRLIEDVLVIDHGRLLLGGSAAELAARGAEVTGRAEDVDAVTFGRQVLAEKTLGRTKQAIVYGDLNGVFERRAAEAGVDVGPLPLQTLFVHLTGAGTVVDDPEPKR